MEQQLIGEKKKPVSVGPLWPTEVTDLQKIIYFAIAWIGTGEKATKISKAGFLPSEPDFQAYGYY